MKKVLSVLTAAICITVCTLSLTACNFFNGTTTPKIPALATPQNLAFDKDTYILSWDSVENADSYTISYNESIINVDAAQTCEQIFITAEQNTFKVKAVGDGVSYTDSGWSKELTYTIATNSQEQPSENNLTTFEKVNVALAKAAKDKGYELQRVVGISYVDTESKKAGMTFETLCEKDGGIKNVRFSLTFDKNMSEVEMLENIDLVSEVDLIENEIINYNSAQYMLDGNALDGKMLELKNQGYTFTVVDSFVTKGKEFSGNKIQYDIVGTYKAERGGEVKYVTNITKVQINNASTKEKTNYEESLLVPQRYTLKETRFVLHEGTMAYMGELIKRAVATAD